MPGGPTGNYHNAFGIYKLILHIQQSTQPNLIGLSLNPSPESIHDGAGLFKDLLQHIMFVALLLHLGDTHIKGFNINLGGFANQILKDQFVSSDQSDIIIVQVDHPVGILYNWRGI